MDDIIQKLSAVDNFRESPYMINNVIVGIKKALEMELVKCNKEALQELEELYVEVRSIPCPGWDNKIIPADQVSAMRIADEALRIIEELEE